MGKNIYLTESQFRDLTKYLMLKESEETPQSELDMDDIARLFSSMVLNDFTLYFQGGQRYVCNSLHEKGEIFDGICNSPSVTVTPDGKIQFYMKKYGYVKMDYLN
jgi:hypothetical protein